MKLNSWVHHVHGDCSKRGATLVIIFRGPESDLSSPKILNFRRVPNAVTDYMKQVSISLSKFSFNCTDPWQIKSRDWNNHSVVKNLSKA